MHEGETTRFIDEPSDLLEHIQAGVDGNLNPSKSDVRVGRTA